MHKSEYLQKFYTIIDRILENINSKKNKNKIFEKSKNFPLILIKILIAISLYTTTLIPSLEYDTQGLTGFTIFCISIQIAYIFIFILSNKPSVGGIFLLIVLLLFSCPIYQTLPLYDAICESRFYLCGIIFGLICVIAMIVFYKLMPKRNSYGNEILGKIKGFKTFLTTARKDELEAMVMENPTYFYDILPYTYVLGVSSKWIKQFESISLKAPDWYYSSRGFDINSFEVFFNHTMISATNAMTSSPSDNYHSSGGGFSGSSGSSGGGFSGGGSGGGGGGSW